MSEIKSISTPKTCAIAGCELELCTDSDQTFHGIGRVTIDGTQVRSGRLPWRVFSQSFTGHELRKLNLERVEESEAKLTVHLSATFQPMLVKLMRDHSFDPIYDLGDWEKPCDSGSAKIRIVFTPADASYDGVDLHGLRYSIEYESEDTPVFHLLERGSWELGGNIEGATVYNQSACSSPVVTIEPDTFWSTEGFLHKLDPVEHPNRCMTHNLPRWCDHQWFDFQSKGDQVLVGIYDRVELIRSVLCRDPGKPELKSFDKHIFDETQSFSTAPRAIMINRNPVKTETQKKNLWTRIYEQTSDASRAEFGLKEERPSIRMGMHYWFNYTIDTYYKDIVPASINLGTNAIFAENFKKSDASEPNQVSCGNMCCSHEYEIAEAKGGMKKFKEYIETCKKHGISNFLWTNTYVSLAAKMNPPSHGSGKFMNMENCRLKYAGAYTAVSSNLNFKDPEIRKYYVDSHVKIAEESGLEGYFIDSHYNLFFMPLTYGTGHPQTVWRESLEVMKEIEDAGLRFQIESFGPFGACVHGHDAGYTVEHAFICIDVGVGTGAVTVPVPGIETNANIQHNPGFIFYIIAHRAPHNIPLFMDGVRADEVYGDEHRRIIRLFNRAVNDMDIRYLQEDNLGVLYHTHAGDHALLWNFEDRTVSLPGKVTDYDSGEALPGDGSYALKGRHVYRIEADSLPKTVS